MIFTETTRLKLKVLSRFILLVLAGFFIACQPPEKPAAEMAKPQESPENPPAEGFDLENSDPMAMKIADQVMQAMGGRASWDNTRYLSWDFFGARKLVWDKHLGNVRVEFPDSTVYLVNIYEDSGKAYKNGNEVTNPDSLKKELDKAKRIWINDSYWLVMPFKLKDSGVTLKYMGTENVDETTPSHVLQLTFKEVGVTPQNRYLVYVDTSTHLVNQWAYFREATQDSANFMTSWANYKKYGDILLSDRRGERSLEELMVMDSLPEEVFSSFQPIVLPNH